MDNEDTDMTGADAVEQKQIQQTGLISPYGRLLLAKSAALHSPFFNAHTCSIPFADEPLDLTPWLISAVSQQGFSYNLPGVYTCYHVSDREAVTLRQRHKRNLRYPSVEPPQKRLRKRSLPR